MKNSLLFILVLVIRFSFACGFYPYGELTRISLFNPAVFGYDTYSSFYYSANFFSTSNDYSTKEYTLPNVKLWFEYCRGKVDMQAIHMAVYQLNEADIDEHTQNAMIHYLYQKRDSEALHYLRFAKRCEFFNSLLEDPWERNVYLELPKRIKLMNCAIGLAKKVQHKVLKRRYIFLAIRLAWYNHDFEKIRSLFDSVFGNTSSKDILYYWSLYFRSFAETNSARANFELAQVFANAVDKRFACHQHYNTKVSLDQTLQFAQTSSEKANVYLLYGIERPDKALQYLQEMYVLRPDLDGLSFLLLREINKIEDYVLTPYYTLFQPSVSYDYWDNKNSMSTLQALKRSEHDRLYAREVLQFLNSVDMRKVQNPVVWQCCKAYLQFIVRDYDACLIALYQAERSTSDNLYLNQLQMLKALAMTASQPNGSAEIPAAIQATIIDNQTDGQFIFAIGKELEYLGNTTDAAILYAKLDKGGLNNSTVFWKTIKNDQTHGYYNYFEDYFSYADAVYTPAQVQCLIDDIQKHKDSKDQFAIFKFNALKNEISLLYDLLGTKYIRQNKLESAFASFKKIDNRYWSRAYTAWGDHYNIFYQNPFYHLKYTPKFITQKDTIRLNKCTITQQLIDYLNKAQDKNEKDRDYYYFLVANAYYNMGREGNVPMMRRMQGWSGFHFSVIEDEAEFRQSNLAKKYYLFAKQYAKTDKFKALCLRMLVRCERNRLQYRCFEVDDCYGRHAFDSLLAHSQYYRELQLKYSDHFSELVSNCDNFEAYFKARR